MGEEERERMRQQF